MWSMGKFALVLGAALAVASVSFGHTQKTKPVQCPVCKMFLATKPTKASTVAIRLKKGGPIYYCCPKCKMPASMLVKPTKH